MSAVVVCPTYKRAGKVKTIKIFGDWLTLACHRSEAAKYRKAYPKNHVLAMPDSLKGNMAKVRNWILYNSHPGRSGEILMVDDDLSYIALYEKMKKRELGREQVKSLVEAGFRMCREAGTRLWGINLQYDPDFYREYSPFSFLSPVLGPFLGIFHDHKDAVEFDADLGLNEDFDFFLQMVHRFHRVLRFNKYHYFANHLTQDGGCAAYRTMPEERRQAEMMVKKWGSKVVQYNFFKSPNPLIHVPIKGI